MYNGLDRNPRAQIKLHLDHKQRLLENALNYMKEKI